MTLSNWTPERKTEAAKLYRDGLSCAQIAQHLGGGLSRNAVIGILTRMGVTKHGRASAPSKANVATIRRAPVRHVTIRQAADKPEPSPQLAVVPPPIRMMANNTAGRPIPLFCEPVEYDVLTRRQCCFPVTHDAPFKFCGMERIEGKPYCVGHHQLAHVAGTNGPQKEKSRPQRETDYRRERQVSQPAHPDATEMFA